MLLIGIDCATKDSKIGIALAEYAEGEAILKKVCSCSKARSAVSVLISWLKRRQGPALLALDSPRGWPNEFGRALNDHAAGAPLPHEADQFFRRETDRFIKRQLGKTSLDVGADKIARTALAALTLLADLGTALGEGIPLAWSPDSIPGFSAIEVYPAATLIAHGLQAKDYKTPKQFEVLQRLKGEIHRLELVHGLADHKISNADELDAVVCVLAAKDFLAGGAMQPENLPLAKKEGWIWSRPRVAYG